MNHALLNGWARRIERDEAGAVVRFELQQTRNLNHAIPVEIAREAAGPDWLTDGAPVRVEGHGVGHEPQPGDRYAPQVTFVATACTPVTDFSTMPPREIFEIEPPDVAISDDFVPPADQFGQEGDHESFNTIVVCGYLDQALLGDGVNEDMRRDTLEVLLRVARPPVPALHARLYGTHALKYARVAGMGLPVKITGALRIRTKPRSDDADARDVLRLLYIHCATLRVPLMDELPYLPDWLDRKTSDAVA